MEGEVSESKLTYEMRSPGRLVRTALSAITSRERESDATE